MGLRTARSTLSNNNLKNMLQLTAIKDLNKKQVENIMTLAAEMEEVLEGKKTNKCLENKVIASLFYEPSTRTRLSFETAVLRLGGQYLSVIGGDNSSTKKGETLEDTIKMVQGYADGIIMRHPEKGAASKAVSVMDKPFLNAGDGTGEHPTQALLDLYTIVKQFGRVDGLKVAMVGDLRFGRTVHSLINLLSLYEVEVALIAPEQLRMPDSVLKQVEGKIKYTESENLADAADSDVVYMTRVQKERFWDPGEYDKYKDVFIINKQFMDEYNDKGIIMHPLPRVNEITTEVDSDPRAKYFEQAQNGVPTRMALLAMCFED